MTEALVWAGSITTYLLGVMITARILHIRIYKAWVKWRNEAPDQCMRYYGHDYFDGSVEKPRKEMTLEQFIYYVDLGVPRIAAFMWPFIGPYFAIQKFCFPENIKVADHTRIKELEKIISDG